MLAAQPVASIIAGATSPEQVRANAAAIGWRMSEADLNDIDAIIGRVNEPAGRFTKGSS